MRTSSEEETRAGAAQLYASKQVEQDNGVIVYVILLAPERECVIHTQRYNICSVAREVFCLRGERINCFLDPHLRGMALTEPDVDQEAHSTRCGQLCMAFGHVFVNHGYDAAKMC